jgi:hypothetical protein
MPELHSKTVAGRFVHSQNCDAVEFRIRSSLVEMPSETVVHYWTLVDQGGQVATCQLIRTSSGLEVQCRVRSPERLLSTAPVKTLHDAFNQSEAWRASYTARGWRSLPEVT